jgi:hypothetical protein
VEQAAPLEEEGAGHHASEVSEMCDIMCCATAECASPPLVWEGKSCRLSLEGDGLLHVNRKVVQYMVVAVVHLDAAWCMHIFS